MGIVGRTALCASLVVASWLAAEPARAEAIDCSVNRVQYDRGRLVVWCSNDSKPYYALDSVTGCAVQTIDTLRIWAAMAQAALLSGKYAVLSYDTCGMAVISAITVHN